jgi:ferredoxin
MNFIISYLVKCTECTGFHEEPQCAAVCPVDCCVPDPDYVETKEELAAKKAWLHQEVTSQ